MTVGPLHAPMLGGAEVMLNGAHFLSPTEARIWCLFGTTSSSLALWEAPNRLICRMPTMDQSGTVHFLCRDLNEYESRRVLLSVYVEGFLRCRCS